MSKAYYQLIVECREAQAKTHSLEAAAARICPISDGSEKLRRELMYLDLAASARGSAESNRRLEEMYP